MRGDRLRQLRNLHNMSQEDLGDRIGVQGRQVLRWENNQSKPSSDHVRALARELDVSADYLLGITDEPYQLYEQSDLSPMEQRLIGALRAGRLVPAAKYYAALVGDEDGNEPEPEIEINTDI